MSRFVQASPGSFSMTLVKSSVFWWCLCSAPALSIHQINLSLLAPEPWCYSCGKSIIWHFEPSVPFYSERVSYFVQEIKERRVINCLCYLLVAITMAAQCLGILGGNLIGMAG